MTALANNLRSVLPALLAVLALVLATGAADAAHAAPNKDGGGDAKGCKYGGKVGEVREFVVETYLNGKLVRTQTVKKKCGEDGTWHNTKLMPQAGGVRPADSAASTGARS